MVKKRKIKGHEKNKLLGIVGRVLLVMIILGICAIPPVYLSGIVGYGPFLFVVFILILSAIYLYILKKSFHCENEFNVQNCRRKSASLFQIHMKNLSIFVFPKVEAIFFLSDIYGNADSNQPLSISLAPRETRTLDFEVRFDHIGRYKTGLKEIRIYGLLGLLCVKLPVEVYYDVNVSPNIYDIEKLSISQEVHTEDDRSNQTSELEGSDYVGVREYVAGDPIKNIHWKLSAHSENFLTKQMESYGIIGVSVILDLCCPDTDVDTRMGYFDTLVETAVSICFHAQSTGMEHDIRYFNKYGEETCSVCHDTESVQSLVWDLPVISSDRNDYDIGELLLHTRRDRSVKNNIAVCTCFLTEELLRSLIEIYYNGSKPSLFYVISPEADEKDKETARLQLRMLDGMGIPYYMFADTQYLE